MSQEDQKTHYGLVTTFNALKGFGFIRRKEGKDVFFFYDDLEDDEHDINIGDQVKFTVELAPRGPKAKHIRKMAPNEV